MTIRVQKLYQITCDGSDPCGPEPEDLERCSNQLAQEVQAGNGRLFPAWMMPDEVRAAADEWGWLHAPVLRIESRMFSRPNDLLREADYQPFPAGQWYCPRHRPDKDKR